MEGQKQTRKRWRIPGGGRKDLCPHAKLPITSGEEEVPTRDALKTQEASMKFLYSFINHYCFLQKGDTSLKRSNNRVLNWTAWIKTLRSNDME